MEESDNTITNSLKAEVDHEPLDVLKSYSYCYIFDAIEDVPDKWFERAIGIVSAKRRIKALSYINPLDQKLSILAELLLLYALYQEGVVGSLPEISEGPYGKPYFKKYPSLYFNISHCHKSVACVICDTPVGVDVENSDFYSPDIARMVLSEYEMKNVCAAESPEQEFSRYWTMKESYLKYLGTGLCDNMSTLFNTIQGVHFQTTYYSKGYTCSVCTDNEHVCKTPVLLPLNSLLEI